MACAVAGGVGKRPRWSGHTRDNAHVRKVRFVNYV
jgi:hypothetical protein